MATSASPLPYTGLFERRLQQLSVPLTIDIYSWYRHMQTSHPVYFDTTRAAWLVFRYDDVQRVLLDTATFSSQRTVNSDGIIDPLNNLSILGADPPDHRQLRTSMAQAFTPKTIAALEPRITSIVHTLLDQVQGKGEMDIVDDLAFPLPITVIAELLGVRSTDRNLFRQWSADFVGPDYDLRLAASQKIAHYFQELIEQRRNAPREDLISDLLKAEIDGEHLPEREIQGACLLLLIAGHETTTSLISNTIVCLDEHPDVLHQLITQPELLPPAIEEVLRYRAVVHTILRVVTVDTIVGGQEIQAGSLLLPLFAAANLDEAQFPNPDSFDIQRTPNRHMGFGYGIHFCLGATLARLEARIALAAMLERLPNMRRIRTIPLELRPSASIYGLKHVPITFG